MMVLLREIKTNSYKFEIECDEIRNFKFSKGHSKVSRWSNGYTGKHIAYLRSHSLTLDHNLIHKEFPRQSLSQCYSSRWTTPKWFKQNRSEKVELYTSISHRRLIKAHESNERGTLNARIISILHSATKEHRGRTHLLIFPFVRCQARIRNKLRALGYYF
jgi:hypothetical protein